MQTLNPVGLVLSIIAVVLGIMWIGIILLDDWLITHGLKSISERLLKFELSSVVGTVVVFGIAGLATFVLGALGGHLWGSDPVWRYMLLFATLTLTLGFLFGRMVFGQ